MPTVWVYIHYPLLHLESLTCPIFSQCSKMNNLNQPISGRYQLCIVWCEYTALVILIIVNCTQEL